MKQRPTVPPKRPDESDEQYSARLLAWINEEPRSKGDLKNWKSCDFTFAPERNDK